MGRKGILKEKLRHKTNSGTNEKQLLANHDNEALIIVNKNRQL